MCVCVDITVAVVAVTNEHTSSHTFADSIDSVTSEGKEEKRAQSKGEWKEFTESEREREREREFRVQGTIANRIKALLLDYRPTDFELTVSSILNCQR